MKKLFVGLILSALLGLHVLAALKVADKAPDFSARASLAGKEFDFSALSGNSTRSPFHAAFLKTTNSVLVTAMR